MSKISRSNRKGTVFFCVLASLAIVVSIMLSSAQHTLRVRQQLRTHRQLQQASLLCDAGAVRARDQLTKNPDYNGETWRPPLNLHSGEEAEILIECRLVPNKDQRTCTVQAKISEQSTNKAICQRTKQFILQNDKP